ncbi:hypothetical protein MMP61_18585 [Acinetobacter sp. NIPH 1958]|uniref:hypothetical protein n=1 Tax=Acinetobacter sp. NIPH 1958 TaxID=2923430 RepID=UPI001F4A2E3B|nr:hypothetical protein [Acinetobacter sp. NIPH 1958]MCH7357546.1 hypothetical protein [Acinetobacter sp. NIPH 1958]
MDICEINWGYWKDVVVALISAGIPSFVAWKIYRGWNNQKASEVIANEAKQFISKLATLQSLQGEIYKTLYESGGYNIEPSKIIEFKETRKIFNDSAILLGEAIQDKKISHYSTTVMAQALLFQRDIQEYLEGAREIKKVRFIDPSDAKQVTGLYLGYALYKKKI